MRRAWLLVLVLGLAGCGGGSSGGDDEARSRPTTQARERTAPEATPTRPPEVTPIPTPRPRRGELRPTQDDAERLATIISGWVDAVRRGNVARAAEAFNVPAIVAQGRGAVTLVTREDVRRFNAALPCGATLEEVQHDGRYVIGTFRLLTRPGIECDAPGQLTRVAFVLRGGRISEWRQIPDIRGAEPGPPEPEPAPPAISEGQESREV